MTKIVHLFCALAMASQLTLSSMAEQSEPYIWRNVVIGGGGFVTGIITHPRQKDLMYARTDVGGAYRWDSAVKQWIPITDWIGRADVNLTGIESLAVDPSDPNRVYLAAGTYSGGNAAIFRSEDQGRTFKRTNVPFKMGGNEAGRFNGERLAVDPNQGGIIFFGSRRDGLWKSADAGATWQKVETFPNVGPGQPPPGTTNATANPRRRAGGFGQQLVGVVCVLFDASSGKPGNPTPTIYAAVSTSDTNLLRSTDGGASWFAVANQPVGLRPNHIVRAPDGTLFLTYGKEAGPNTMTDGAVWKYNPRDGAWTDITPLKPKDADQPFGYGAVTVDAQHPATIMVTTFCHWKPLDEVFRSTNGGASWSGLLQNARWDYSSAPYTETRKPHWMGDIEINPFNPDQVLFTTGYGIWSCVNATEADSGRPTRWVFLDSGLEETVPLALISPPEGAHLLSGVGDVDGFRHEDLTVSPAQGSFAGPRFSNTEDMAFAGRNPGVIVRSGTGGNGVARAAISFDGGKTWSALGSEPPGSAGAGTIAVSADGRTIVWTPRRAAPHFSVNLGTNWSACSGLLAGIRVIADEINQTRFYAFDARAGKCLVSTNGAAGFIATEAVLPQAQDNGFGGGIAATLFATPGIEGDLWLAYETNGLFHSANSGVSFVKVERVQAAHSLGFGKAKAAKVFPALYLAGTIEQRQALFRSDDAGENWIRVNDDQHQFGWVSRVTGDPRIYGRVYFATGGRGIIYGEQSPARDY